MYMDLETYNGIRMIQHNNEEQMREQYQQSIVMTSGEQPQEVIIQDDSQRIVYSPLKANEPQQYLSQVEPMQGQPYLIQSHGQSQVVYANISPQNQIRNQQLNHNLIAQQNQNQQKVIL